MLQSSIDSNILESTQKSSSRKKKTVEVLIKYRNNKNFGFHLENYNFELLF